MCTIITPLLLLFLLAAENKLTPKFPVGKETTHVRGPLDKEGYIGYEAALNERLGKGITPERNANVLLWKAFGPRPEGGGRMPAQYFKVLGIEEPPQDGTYYLGLRAYLSRKHKLAGRALAAFDRQKDRAYQRPWTTEDYPYIAEWLGENERPLAIVIEATKRPEYFNPFGYVQRRVRSGLLV
jgi:hypothetical protein